MSSSARTDRLQYFNYDPIPTPEIFALNKIAVRPCASISIKFLELQQKESDPEKLVDLSNEVINCYREV